MSYAIYPRGEPGPLDDDLPTDAEREAVMALFPDPPARRGRHAPPAVITYRDVLRALRDRHDRAQLVLRELHDAGMVDWRANGDVRRREAHQ